MIEIVDKRLCCGCEACVQACSRQCISYEEDAEGFRYPLVDKSICIDCGLCEKVCPVINQAKIRQPLKAFAAKNKDEQQLLASSSGGVFVLLAKAVISEGGVVFGAKFDKDWTVIHSYTEAEEEVNSFMGSKYTQSRIGDSYAKAKEYLMANRRVLFTGTSCQIAGLKRFLRKDYDNLLAVDVVCHGVPSPKVWKMYLEELKRNAIQGSNSVLSSLKSSVFKGDINTDDVHIDDISFRDKQFGWEKYSFALTFTKTSVDGKTNTVSVSHIHREDPFMKTFLNNIILRPSCYQCPAKSGKSMSDITIADFWGIAKVLPEFNDHRGVGLVIVNSEKGLNIINGLDIDIMTVDFKSAISGNPSYVKSVQEHRNRKKFFSLLSSTNSIIDLFVFVLRPTLKTRICRFLLILKRKLF